MNLISLNLLEHAIAYLFLSTIGIGLAVYILVFSRNQRGLWKQARRVQLSSYLVPPLNPQTLNLLWSRSSTVDREILEDILVDQCRLVSDEELRKTTENLLIAAGPHERWIRSLQKGRASDRTRAALNLGYVHDTRSVEALMAASTDSGAQVRLAVCLSLGRLRDPIGLPGLARLAHEPSAEIPDLTLAAALAACACGCPRRLVHLLRGPEARTRVIGAWALSESADETVVPELLKASRDREPEVRAKIARAWARVRGQESLNALTQLARDPVWFVRVRALDALGNKGEPSGESAVVFGLEDAKAEVRCRAAFALRQIHGMSGETLTRVLSHGSGGSFQSLISEWDRAGFLSNLVAGLSTRDWRRFVESQELLKTVIAAGIIRPLLDLVLIFPDIKVRLRLLHLLFGASDPKLPMELRSVADRPGCDPLLARAIKEGI